jgi:Fic family protein
LEILKLAEEQINYLSSAKIKSEKHDDAVLKILKEIDAVKKKLNKFRKFDSYRIAQALELEYTFESNRIEGNTLTLRETDLVIKAETVSEKLGQDWDIQSLQLNMITLGGNVEEDDDTFRLHWN